MIVGFIGLGRMGLPLAANIVSSGFRLYVWNRTKSKASPVLGKGAVFAESPKAMAEKCDVVFLSVSDGRAVRRVLFGSNGVAESGKKGLIIVDTSTINPLEAIAFAKVLLKKGMVYLEAPLLSAPRHIEQKSATFVVSGDRRAFGTVLPLLRTSSDRIVYFGKSGSASYIKIANNLIHGVLVTALCEAVLICKKAGLDLRLVKEALDGSTVSSSTSRKFMQCCLENRFPSTFTNRLRLKDSEIAADCGRHLGVPTPVNNETVKLFRAAINFGLGDESPYAIVKIYERLGSKKRNVKKRQGRVGRF